MLFTRYCKRQHQKISKIHENNEIFEREIHKLCFLYQVGLCIPSHVMINCVVQWRHKSVPGWEQPINKLCCVKIGSLSVPAWVDKELPHQCGHRLHALCRSLFPGQKFVKFLQSNLLSVRTVWGKVIIEDGWWEDNILKQCTEIVKINISSIFRYKCRQLFFQLSCWNLAIDFW